MFALPATFNHAQAAPSLALESLVRAQQWHIDCAALQSFDSSVLAFLLDMRRAAVADKAKLTIEHIPVSLTQLATLYGVNELIATA